MKFINKQKFVINSLKKNFVIKFVIICNKIICKNSVIDKIYNKQEIRETGNQPINSFECYIDSGKI